MHYLKTMVEGIYRHNQVEERASEMQDKENKIVHRNINKLENNTHVSTSSNKSGMPSGDKTQVPMG